MVPPATKRRKLEQGADESEGSFAEFSADSAAEDVGAGSDVSMEPLDDDDEAVSDGSEDEEEDEEEEEEEEDDEKDQEQVAAPAKATATAPAKPNKRPAATLQDGAYTAETFKSNMFKLQVDELLEQVKPRHGKKAAAADNAMRTLKTIIEQIPARDPLSVRSHVQLLLL
jgi:U3 small nucleolar RNA-associated protein 22